MQNGHILDSTIFMHCSFSVSRFSILIRQVASHVAMLNISSRPCAVNKYADNPTEYEKNFNKQPTHLILGTL